MTLTFIVLLLVPFITMVAVLTQVSNSVIGKSIEESTSQTMDQYASFVTTLTTQVEDVANQVLSNEITQKWITAKLDKGLTTEMNVSLDAEMRTYLSSIALNHSSISSITLFNEQGSAVGIRDQSFRDPSFLQSPWYINFKEKEIRWVPAHQDAYQPAYLVHESMNSLIFNLVQLSSFRKIGVLKVNMQTKLVQDPLDKIKFGEKGRVYLVDRQGQPVLNQNISPDMALFRTELGSIVKDKRTTSGKLTVGADGEKHLVLYRKIKNADWLLIGEVPQYELFQKMKNVQYTMTWVGAGLLLLTIAAAFWLSSGIARPLSRLAGAMRLVERGGFTRPDHEVLSGTKVPANEVGYVITVFRNMIARLRILIETEFRSNMRRKDAEYKALLMQINPHFLYNTLEAIGSLSAQKRSDEVIDVTERLGQMLRYSLRVNSDLAKLSEELQYIRYYIDIMSVRFGDRLRVEIEEDEGIRDVTIVKFILQPLVENAIKFGLENPDGALVRVSARRSEEGRIGIEVSDNGPGMPRDRIEELYRELKEGRMTEVLGAGDTRIGLRNAVARCSLYYGPGFELSIESRPGEGTRLVFGLPVKEKEE
ncbi:cache domain-containing sensor histidine kinase [Cohnella thailandensis]|uniref:histidine kinase n=1 Tax=Cohnella thailandensis TaxID=557557 RepID=A0A841SZ23_9BACL|nr:sensor histidine kinase [Cohnella thailandensis]MBB6637453.1 sensor histidine kinase [Cohnella thailandensis]MBP1977829.1 two-component system sensor histidine kinase YesM [Cohnella thailandensis]